MDSSILFDSRNNCLRDFISNSDVKITEIKTDNNFKAILYYYGCVAFSD